LVVSTLGCNFLRTSAGVTIGHNLWSKGYFLLMRRTQRYRRLKFTDKK
jgi:hypothetical protein